MSQDRKTKAELAAELAAARRQIEVLQGKLAGREPLAGPPKKGRAAHGPITGGGQEEGIASAGVGEGWWERYFPRFCIWDPDHRLIFGDETFTEWFGRPRDELKGVHASEILGKAAYEALAPKLNGALAGQEQVFQLEIFYKTKGLRAIQGHYVPRVDPDGKVTGIYAAIIDITHNLQAEQALRESEKRSRDFAEVSSDWFWEMDAGLHFSWVSDRQEEISGVAAAKVAGKGFAEVVFPAGQEGDGAGWLAELREHQPLNTFAYWSAGGEGEGRYVSIHGVPVFGAGDAFQGYRGTVTDLTERKKAEDTLEERERFLRLFTDAAPVLISFVDQDMRYGFANATHAQWMNREPGSYLGKRMEEVNSPKGFAAIAPRVARALAGEVVKEEDEVVFPDGKTRIVHHFFAPLKDAQGNVLGAFSMADDITEQREAEEARRESEKRFETTVNASPMSMFLKDREARFIMVNSTFERWNGTTAREALGKTAHDLFPREMAERFALLDGEVLRTGTTQVDELEIRMPDGVTRTLVRTKFPILAEDGNVAAVGTIGADITDQRKVEQQLREAQKMEAVGQLAGGVAHDFNNALQVIINSAHFIQTNKHKVDSVADFAGMILKAGERAAELTQQLLAFSRRNVIQPKPLDLNELTQNLLRMLERIIGEQIQLTFQPGQGMGVVEADRGTLEQVIINLCVNARDAMPEGGDIVLETRNEYLDAAFCEEHGLPGPGDYATLSVTDGGLGMDPEVREHLFEPFFTTKEVGEGTGLGLAMAYGIVQQHHGHIEVSSEPGLGSTFKIFLPLSEAEKPAPVVPVELPEFAGQEKVLVAEDEETVRNMLARLLESVGYQVCTARNGTEALEKFESLWPEVDLLFLDMVMPEMGGREVYEEIRKKWADIPVIFSTGYTPETADLDFIKKNGMVLVQKPFSPKVLFSAVRDTLERHPRHQPAASRAKN